jgi:hypothetical protein
MPHCQLIRGSSARCLSGEILLPSPHRVYSDGLSKDHKQSFISWLVAVITLTIYTGWMHILLGLLLGSFFSRTCLYVLLALWATTWLPAKPVLWSAFCSSWVSLQSLQSEEVAGTAAVMEECAEQQAGGRQQQYQM